MKFLLSFSGKRVIALLMVSSLGIVLLDFAGIILIYPFLRLFLTPDVIQTNPHIHHLFELSGCSRPVDFVSLVGFGLICFYLGRFMLKMLLLRLKCHTMDNTTCRLASHLFKGMLGSRYAFFTDKSGTELVTVINSHSLHAMICLEKLLNISNEIIFFTAIICALIIMNPGPALVFITVFFCIGVLMYFLLSRRIQAYGQVHGFLVTQIYKLGFAATKSIKDLKIMGLEGRFSERFSDLWYKYANNYSKSTTVKGIPREFTEMLVLIGLVSTCLYVQFGRKDMLEMIPTLGFIAVAFMRIMPSFNQIIGSYNEYRFYLPSLHLVLDLNNEIKKYVQNIEVVHTDFRHAIEVSDLSLSYGQKVVLDEISFTINKGKSLAFVGVSGAGKSTLLDVVVGLREPDSGVFRIDGRPFSSFNSNILRSRVGYVPQDVSLLDESVAFNISFEQDYDKAKIARVLKMARLTHFIEELPDGVETVLGENGVRVSGGQKQRIGIARALYRDPEIIVFDEATSALDTLTERELMDEINSLSGTKTIILVAHRLSTVEKCDVICFLEKGRIVAQGRHDELLKTSSLYRNLYFQQSVESKTDVVQA